MTVASHPHADTVLTDQEQQEAQDHLRQLDADRPLTHGVKTSAGSPDAWDAEVRENSPGDQRPSPHPVTGELALDDLRSAVSSARGAKATMTDVECRLPLPSRALTNVIYAVGALESAIRDMERGNWP